MPTDETASEPDRTKTQAIRDFFAKRPNQILSPAEIARSLTISTHVTSTIVNRLTAEGKIERTGRGKYRYGRVVDAGSANELYLTIYQDVANNIGLRAIETMTRMKSDSFDKGAPVESIAKLLTSLAAWFGRETVAAILRNLEKKLDDESMRALLLQIKWETTKSG